MSSPERIFIDERVVRTMETTDKGPNDVAYVREDIFQKKLAELRETEFVIQFEITQEGGIVGLTNLGKILIHERGKWLDPEAGA